MGTESPKLAIAAAVNDHATLAQCLARSPDIANGTLMLKTYEGFSTAGIAYNQALDESTAEYLLFAHQDVYLPGGFARRMVAALDQLSTIAPDWAIAGVVGARHGEVIGKVWCSGNNRVIGEGQSLPARANTLDELIIIVRRSSGLRFDEVLPSFHLYAADIILTAAAAGQTTWVVDVPVVHHSRPVVNLGGGYKEAWNYMRRKWRANLPIENLVCTITASPFSLWEKDLRLRVRHRGRSARAEAVGDPVEIAKRLGFEPH
jgi:Glycosyltransferase like family